MLQHSLYHERNTTPSPSAGPHHSLKVARELQRYNLHDLLDASDSTNREHAKAHALWPLMRCVAIAAALWGGGGDCGGCVVLWLYGFVVVCVCLLWSVCVDSVSWLCVRVDGVRCGGVGFSGIVCACQCCVVMCCVHVVV